MIKHFSPIQTQRLFTTLVLTGILSLSAGLTLFQSASANSKELSQPPSSERIERDNLSRDRQEKQQGTRANRLPPGLANAVRREASRASRIPVGRLRVIQSSQETWSNGCLGLGQPDQICTQALVPGWRVVVSDGSQKTWVYRTDLNGRVLRLENQRAANNLPQSVADAALQAAASRLRVSTSSLRIVQAERQNWSNGCLGLEGSDVFCTQVITPGWQVTVEGRQQRLVYRTNESGSNIKLDTAASNIGDAGKINPTQIPTSELPAPLQKDVMFQAIASGGITGRTFQTILLKDGRVIQATVNPNGTTSPTQIKQISRQQVQRFQQLLEQQQFSQFNRLNYPAPNGAADYITVTLTSKSGTTRYADIVQNDLPESLRQIIQSWNQISSRS